MAVSLNRCHCIVNQDMLLTKFDIIPILSDICSPKDLIPQTNIKTNRSFNPTVNDILKGSENYANNPLESYPYFNKTDAKKSSALTDEFIMCMDQLLIEPNKNLNSHITGLNSVQKKTSDMSPTSMILDKEDIKKNDSYFNQTDRMEVDPQILLMLKDLNLLSEAVKTKTDIHRGAPGMEDNQTTQIGNKNENTFLKSAVTLYDTFTSYYNMTDDNIHDLVGANYSQQNFSQDKVENINGILFNQDSLFSSPKRYF